MERISRKRAMIFLAIFASVLLLFSMKLFDLQIIETKGDTDNTEVYGTITTVRAARGDILDRNGNVLVGNRASYNLVFNHYVINSYADRNGALYRLVQKCKELGIEYTDHFPVTSFIISSKEAAGLFFKTADTALLTFAFVNPSMTRAVVASSAAGFEEGENRTELSAPSPLTTLSLSSRTSL